MGQEELRQMYKERTKKEKQCYISKQTNICVSALSQFKNGKIDLYPELAKRLEKYLSNN